MGKPLNRNRQPATGHGKVEGSDEGGTGDCSGNSDDSERVDSDDSASIDSDTSDRGKSDMDVQSGK